MPAGTRTQYRCTSTTYHAARGRRADTLRQSAASLTILATMFSVEDPPGYRLADPHQPLAEAVHQLLIGVWQVVEKAVDGFDDDAPLREAGHRAEGIKARFEFVRHSNTELRIVLDLLSLSGAGRRSTGAASFSFIGHGQWRW